jgi:hypothetical protein
MSSTSTSSTPLQAAKSDLFLRRELLVAARNAERNRLIDAPNIRRSSDSSEPRFDAPESDTDSDAELKRGTMITSISAPNLMFYPDTNEDTKSRTLSSIQEVLEDWSSALMNAIFSLSKENDMNILVLL